jgi:hypothetical protein
MNEFYMFATANLGLCLGIVFVSICRLNSMQNKVLWRCGRLSTAVGRVARVGVALHRWCPTARPAVQLQCMEG